MYRVTAIYPISFANLKDFRQNIGFKIRIILVPKTYTSYPLLLLFLEWLCRRWQHLNKGSEVLANYQSTEENYTITWEQRSYTDRRGQEVLSCKGTMKYSADVITTLTILFLHTEHDIFVYMLLTKSKFNVQT